MYINNNKLVLWNAQSIKNKITEFTDYLNTNQIDLALVTETWLKPNISLSIPNYKIVRLDRINTRGGGVAIIINENIKYTEVAVSNLKVIESVGVNILSESDSLTCFVCYFPGGKCCVSKNKSFVEDLKKLIRYDKNCILGGDFNARHSSWGCVRSNLWGKSLHDLSITHPISILYPSEHTYQPSNNLLTPSILDLYLINSSINLSTPIADCNLSSDHLPVRITLHPKSACLPNRQSLNIKRANWNTFKCSLKHKLKVSNLSLASITTEQDIDKLVEIFYNAINEALENSAPKTKIHNPINAKIPEHILELIKLKNKTRKQWHAYRTVALKRQLNKLNRSVRQQIYTFRNKSWSDKLSSLQKGCKTMWNLTKIMKNKSCHLPPLYHDAKKYLTTQEKANALAENFSRAHAATSTFSDQETIQEVNDKINNLNQTRLSTPNKIYFTPKKVFLLIKTLKNRKAAGDDNLKAEVFKQLPKQGIIFITFIFNACLKISYFPNRWKTAKVIPILKPGKDPKDVSSYRPISLLNTVCKIFEKLIHEMISIHLETNPILPPQQLGFRPKYTTSHQLKRITGHIKGKLELGLSTGVVLLDIEKAFDSVWHWGLIYKIINWNFPTHIVKIVQSFLTDRYFYVYIGNTSSDTVKITAGVPQGSSLSPVLYNIYTSDITENIDCDISLFADDTALYHSDVDPKNITRKLEKNLSSLQAYFFKWKIKTNPTKTACTFFSRKRSQKFLPDRPLKFNYQNIPWSNDIKYLGVHLDKTLTYALHVNKTIEKTNKLIKALYPLIKRHSPLNTSNKLLIFKMVFQPILTYASPVWGNCAKTHKKKLQIQQNKILKMAMDLPWYSSTKLLHDHTNTRLIEDICSKNINRYTNNELCQ